MGYKLFTEDERAQIRNAQAEAVERIFDPKQQAAVNKILNAQKKVASFESLEAIIAYWKELK